MQNLFITLNLVAPVFLIVILGYILKKFRFINDDFVKISAKIVFSVSLPAFIFLEISQMHISEILNPELILFVYIGTFVTFFISWVAAIPLKDDGKITSVFIQGSFRGNFAIVGLALIVSAFGTKLLPKASLVLAFTIPLYNLLSVAALIIPMRRINQTKFSSALFEILKNPLIIAVLLAFPFSIFGIPVHHLIVSTGNYLAAMTLPLALIGIGGFMSFSDVKKGLGVTLYSTILKLIVFPIIAVAAALILGFEGEDVGIIFILFGCPTAIASFIMAEAMGADSKLAGNILLATTLGSVVTITIGLFLLKEFKII